MTADGLLKLLLTDWKRISKFFQPIKKEWFESDIDALIWNYAYECVKKYDDIPSTDLLLAVIQKGESERTYTLIKSRIEQLNILQIPPADEKLVLDIITNLVENTIVSNMLEQSAQLVTVGKVSEVWGKVEAARNELLTLRNGHIPIQVLDEKAIISRYIHSLSQDGSEKVATLIPSLDRILQSGLRHGTLTVILGATSIGKTMSLVYFTAAAALQGVPALYISLEDSKEVIDERFDGLWFGISMGIEERLQKRELAEQYNCKIYTEYCSSLTVSGIKALLDRYKMYGIDIRFIAVDYGDLLVGEGKYRDEHQEQGQVFEDLMRLAEKEDKIVITGAQANRDALAKRIITLKHMGRSFRKAQVAHYVLALSQTEEEETQSLMRFIVLKHKFGRANYTVPVKVIRERQFFKEASQTPQGANNVA